MNVDGILSQVLYCMSGFLFGIFASRYSILGWQAIRRSSLLQCMLPVLFILTAFFLFPFWFITRTETGGFVYYATLLFFFSKGYRNIKKG